MSALPWGVGWGLGQSPLLNLNLSVCVCSPSTPFCPQPIPTGYPAVESSFSMMVPERHSSPFHR